MKKTDLERLNAVKLDGELAKEVRALAAARGADLGDVVAELLRKGLDA